MQRPTDTERATYPLLVVTLWNDSWTEREEAFFDYLVTEDFLASTHFLWIGAEASAASKELEARWELLAARSSDYTIELVEFPPARLEASVNRNRLVSEVANECLSNSRVGFVLLLNPGNILPRGEWPFRCEKGERIRLDRAIRASIPE
jgi:hypothetical protein